MGPLWWLGAFFGTWMGIHLLIFFYNIYLHPLRNMPGNKISALSELYTSYLLITGEYCRKTLDLHEKYGPVVRTGPRELSYNTLTAFNEIYGAARSRTEQVYEKNPVAYIQGTHEAKNVFFAQSKTHGRLRKIIAPAFSESSVRTVEPTIKEQVDKLIRALHDRSGKGNFPSKEGVVDIDAWATYIVFDLLSALSFGESFGCIDMGAEHPWVTNIFGVITHATFVQAAHRLKPYHKILERFFIPEWLEGKFARHLDWTEKTLKKRLENGNSTRRDWLTFYEKGMDQEELFDSFNVLIAAGGETTASTIAAVLYYSTHSPGVMEKLVKEVRGSFTGENEIDVAESKKLKYLRAVIDETMRIHPAVPVGLPRIVPKGGRFIDGQFVPGGTWVSASQMSACLSPMNFFEPKTFHPERWLGDPRFENDNRAVFFPFSLGKRNCIGLHFALAHISLILTRMIWNFDIEPMPGNKDPLNLKEMGIWEPHSLWIRLTTRVLD